MLRLARLVREQHLGGVAERFPTLLPRFERVFAGTNARPDDLAAMERPVARIRERHGFAGDAIVDRHRTPERPVPDDPFRRLTRAEDWALLGFAG